MDGLNLNQLRIPIYYDIKDKKYHLTTYGASKTETVVTKMRSKYLEILINSLDHESVCNTATEHIETEDDDDDYEPGKKKASKRKAKPSKKVSLKKL